MEGYIKVILLFMGMSVIGLSMGSVYMSFCFRKKVKMTFERGIYSLVLAVLLPATAFFFIQLFPSLVLGIGKLEAVSSAFLTLASIFCFFLSIQLVFFDERTK